jgi:hypothetical protein
VSQRGVRCRLEVFRKKDGTGWGVRSLVSECLFHVPFLRLHVHRGPYWR